MSADPADQPQPTLGRARDPDDIPHRYALETMAAKRGEQVPIAHRFAGVGRSPIEEKVHERGRLSVTANAVTLPWREPLRSRNAELPTCCATRPEENAILSRMNTNTNPSPSALPSTPTATATRWTIDPGHSAVGFAVRHLMITNVRGEFERFRGDITYDPAHPEATRIEATIEVASLNTREGKRDSDLRSALFFDVEKHPAMTFLSKRAAAASSGLDVTGDLTIRGTTHEVTLAVRDISSPQTDMRGNPRIGATASTKIKRSDYGMTWNKALETGGVVVADEVTISLELSLLKAA
jgi:polyisoprenoid-binding protein YceI